MGSKTAWAFPGQGLQKPGLGRSLWGTKAWSYFEEASLILGYDLGRLCLEGPQELLRETSYAQPALFVTCYALGSQRLQHSRPDMLLGHSLGEITALGVGGAFSFQEGVRFVFERGRLMAENPGKKGGMAAIIGLDSGRVAELCREAASCGWVQTANQNSPEQTVVSGEQPALERVRALALEHGAKGVIPLNVSGPFHSRLMAPAAAALIPFLEQLPLKTCQIPVLAGDGCSILKKPEQIRHRLARQITEPVRFVDSVRKLVALGITDFVEIGPGPLLINLARRSAPNLRFALGGEGGL